MSVFRLLAILGLSACAALAAISVPGPHWGRIGSRALYAGVAGPVGAPVMDVVFSSDGRTLYVRTATASWSSPDLGESWQPFTVTSEALSPFRGMALPTNSVPPPRAEPQSLIFLQPFIRDRAYALGRNLYRSPDNGVTWINLTADGLGSVIGNWQTSIAFHPADPDLIVVANVLGLWKSADGGLSWSSLNDHLPNFPQVRFVPGARVDDGLRIHNDRLGTFELAWGAVELWSRQPQQEEKPFWMQALPDEDRLRISPASLTLPEGIAATFRVWIGGVPVSGDLTRCATAPCDDPSTHFITAVVALPGEGTATQYYVGTSDGLLWNSEDDGQTWLQSSTDVSGNSVHAIFADVREPRTAIAVLGGAEGSRVFRTTNSGRLWEDMTGNLPAGAIHTVTGSLEGGAIYLAGDIGLFYSADGLRNPLATTVWSAATGDLPGRSVRDLLLDDVGGFLYASVDGYGIYRARAPAVLDALRVLNAADLTRRAAAPGSLLTILGSDLNGVSVSGVRAPVLASGDRESQIQVPFEASGERLELSLETKQGPARVGYPLAAVSPAIFVDRGGPLVLDAGTGRLLGATSPARAGSQVLILATGLGRVQPEWPTGLPAPLENPPATVLPVKAYLNGLPLRVVSSLLAGGYIGTYVVQAEIPAALNFGVGELKLEVGGRQSNPVRIFTQP